MMGVPSHTMDKNISMQSCKFKKSKNSGRGPRAPKGREGKLE